MTAPNPFLPAAAPQQDNSGQHPQYAPQQPAQQQYAPAPQQPQYAPQQPAQQQYAPAPQYAPQQPAQQQYAPAQQQYAPAAQQAPSNGLVARPGAYGTPPAPSTGGARPRLLDMYGRLVLVLPESCQRGIPSRFTDRDGNPQSQDKMTATLIVLDGGPLAFGGEPEKGPAGKGQHTTTVNVPHVVKGLWIQQSKLIEQCEQALAMRLRGEPGMVLGRLWKTGSAQNDPWVLAAPTPEDGAVYDAYVSTTNPFAL